MSAVSLRINLFFFILLLTLVYGYVYNDRPIIGILSKPNNETEPTRSYFSSDYVLWLEQSGARVVPIFFDSSPENIAQLFSYVNGILFTGGILSLEEGTQYFKTAQFIWNLAIEANTKGDYFPIWGTCMGFQLISILGAQDPSVLQRYAYDSENFPLPLIMTPIAMSSKMFGQNMSKNIWDTLTKEPATQNLHHDGVLPETYTENKLLSQMFNLLSYNFDKKGKKFASTIEGKKYPFYGTQWHPERNQFDWGILESLDKSPEALEATQYMSFFFVGETKKNQHKFPSIEAEDNANVHNYPTTYTGGGPAPFPEDENYYFKLVSKSD